MTLVDGRHGYFKERSFDPSGRIKEECLFEENFVPTPDPVQVSDYGKERRAVYRSMQYWPTLNHDECDLNVLREHGVMVRNLTFIRREVEFEKWPEKYRNIFPAQWHRGNTPWDEYLQQQRDVSPTNADFSPRERAGSADEFVEVGAGGRAKKKAKRSGEGTPAQPKKENTGNIRTDDDPPNVPDEDRFCY